MDSPTIARPRVEIDAAVRELLAQQTERVTIIHARVFTRLPTAVRIWPSTFLVEGDGSRRQLLHHFNISRYPHWTLHHIYDDFIHFTLVFEGLGSGCRQFFVLEDIPEPFGFYSEMVERNETDVYEAELMC